MVLLFVPMSLNQTFGQSKKETPFNLIDYNIRMNTSGDGENAWPLRKDRVIGLLRFHKADIFNIQEALPEQMDDLTNGMPEFDHVGVGRDDGIRKGEHMAIFFKKSRFEKLDWGTFWLSETPEKPGLGWDAVCNRTCTWIKFKDRITKKTFFVFDTHLDHRGDVARQKGAELILNRMKVINPGNLPVILTGDFNLHKDASPIQSILKELYDAQDKSITPPYGPEGTCGGFAVNDKPGKIDFIFINDKVSILRHGVLSDSYKMFFPSDHLPVLAELQIK